MTFKGIKIGTGASRARRMWERGEEMVVREEEAERAEGGGGFVPGMPGGGSGRRGELESHRGEDFSTRLHPLMHADRSSGPVFVTAHTLDHL